MKNIIILILTILFCFQSFAQTSTLKASTMILMTWDALANDYVPGKEITIANFEVTNENGKNMIHLSNDLATCTVVLENLGSALGLGNHLLEGFRVLCFVKGDPKISADERHSYSAEKITFSPL